MCSRSLVECHKKVPVFLDWVERRRRRRRVVILCFSIATPLAASLHHQSPAAAAALDAQHKTLQSAKFCSSLVVKKVVRLFQVVGWSQIIQRTRTFLFVS